MSINPTGFNTQSLLEQWSDSYGNGDYDEDPYDDDIYEGQDLPQELQDICDNLDIRVAVRIPLLHFFVVDHSFLFVCLSTETEEGLLERASVQLGWQFQAERSPDDEEDIKSSHEYLNDLEEEYQARTILVKSKRVILQETVGQRHQSPFQLKLLHSSEHKPKPRHTKYFEAKYNKVKAKPALLNSNASAPSSSSRKNKALMELIDEERVSVSVESTNNGEWIQISIQKEHLLVLKQAKLDLLTMQHVNTEILKENQKLRNKLKELTSITEAWLNNSIKVNQCISEKVSTQKIKILGIDQLTKDTSSSRPKDPVFIKSLADNSKMFITGSNKPKLSEAKDITLTNHDTIYSTQLPPLEKLTGAEPVFGPKIFNSILKLKSTFKAETFKGIIINEASSAPVRGNKRSLTSKTNSALVGKLNNVKIEDDPPLAIVMKELNELKLQFSKNKSSYFKNKNSQQSIGTQLKLLKTLRCGIYGEVGVNTFRNAISAHYLLYSSEYVAPPSIDIDRPWLDTIGYEEAIPAKGTLKRVFFLLSGGTGMHKEDQQTIGGLTSLGVTSKERANPQLSSGMSAFNLNKPIYSTSFIIHSESPLENDALAVSIIEADPGNFAPSDFVPQQVGMNKGTKNTLYDHLFADLDSPEDDTVIVVDDTDEDKEDKIHAATNDETKDTLHKLELEKNKAKAEVALLKAQPSFSNVEQHNELLEDKGKKALSLEEAKKESTDSDSDKGTHTTGSMVVPSKTKKLKKFDFITEDGRHIHLTKEEINHQKKLKEDAKAEAGKQEGEREVLKACPNKTRKRRETIYKQIGTRMDYIHTTKTELGINLDIPLRKQDPLDKLNDLENKKRKYADDIHDYFKANKRLKSSVQYKDHLPGTVLNEPVLGMILFSSYHRQDFVTIKDFTDFSNTMLYTVQEIFLRLHQGPELDDHAWTFSSLLLAEIDMRN
nr:hypothetical protein [Tanacetum cinerariifolium]